MFYILYIIFKSCLFFLVFTFLSSFYGHDLIYFTDLFSSLRHINSIMHRYEEKVMQSELPSVFPSDRLDNF